jgi:hypothetical protein
MTFGSLFLDTDRYFGSNGSFFDYRPSCGSFEVNPPFDAQSCRLTVEHIITVLRLSDEQGRKESLGPADDELQGHDENEGGHAEGQQPLSFILVVPRIQEIDLLVRKEALIVRGASAGGASTSTARGGASTSTARGRSYLRAEQRMTAGTYRYLMGLQHRRTGESLKGKRKENGKGKGGKGKDKGKGKGGKGRGKGKGGKGNFKGIRTEIEDTEDSLIFWTPYQDNMLYWLQNDAGAAMWPADGERTSLIAVTFREAWKDV